MSKERLEEINQRILDMKRKSGMPTEVLTWEGWQSVLPIFTKDLEYLQEQAERADMLAHENMEIRKGYQERSKKVQELEKDFELYDIINHKIGMTVNNPNASDDEKWEEANKLLSEAWESDCIHCNGKGFNGLDYCPHCVRGDILKENLELEQQNKRYREILVTISANLPLDGREHYVSIARKALEGEE